MADERPKFKVGLTEFPLVPSDDFKLGDVRLICRVTGMEWDAWCKLLRKFGLMHPPILQGFFAVAVQRIRQATHDEVVEFIDDLPLIDGVELVLPKEKKEATPTEAAETADT